MVRPVLAPALCVASLSGALLAQTPDQAADALGLSHADVVLVQMDGYPGAPATATFSIDGIQHTVQLEPVSIRSDGFRLVEQGEGDVYTEVQPQIPLTYVGGIATLPETVARGSWLGSGLHLRMRMADGTDLWLEPLQDKVLGAASDSYALYRSEDVIPTGATCGTVEDGSMGFANNSGSRDEGLLVPQGFNVAELALDADFEYYQDHGSSTANTQAAMENVINSMNLQYQQDCGITHEISHVIIRTSNNDPYSSSNPSTLLNQFTSHWNNQQQSVHRDVAELFTGKNMNGGVIGIAWLNGVCNSSGYNVVESDCCGSFASKTDLSAHELGHNWGEGHCSCSGWTMNSFLTSGNQFHPTFSAPGITNKGNTLPCIDEGGTPCEVAQYGVGLGGSNIGVLDSNSTPSLGTSFVWNYSGFNANTVGQMIISNSNPTTTFSDATVVVGFQSPLLSVPASSGGSGSGSISVTVPNNPSIVGLNVFTQVGMIDGSTASGWAFTNGLSLDICN